MAVACKFAVGEIEEKMENLSLLCLFPIPLLAILSKNHQNHSQKRRQKELILLANCCVDDKMLSITSRRKRDHGPPWQARTTYH